MHLQEKYFLLMTPNEPLFYAGCEKLPRCVKQLGWQKAWVLKAISLVQCVWKSRISPKGKINFNKLFFLPEDCINLRHKELCVNGSGIIWEFYLIE